MMNEMWLDCWMNTSNNVYSPSHLVYDEFNLHPMTETTHSSHHHPYKPKQHFSKTPNIKNECTDHVEPTSETILYHDYYTSESVYQQNGKELLSPSANKIESEFEQHTITALSKAKNKTVSSPTIVTISCLICGDQSTGVHYGVNTCEGCKGFFRRSVARGMSRHCQNTNNCEITPFNRNSCRYCRFKKCLDVGMSHEASRLGRPIKRTPSDTTNTINNVVESKIPKQQTSSDKSISQKNHLNSVSSTTSNSTFPDCLFQHHRETLVPEIHQEILRKLASMLIYQEKLLTNIETEEIDHIGQIIINAHFQFCRCTFEKIHIKLAEHPPMLAASISDDLNCDPALVWANWQLSFSLESTLRIFKCYTFSQKISQHDQICLFRYGAFQTILVSWFTLFDTERKLMLTLDFAAYMDRNFIKKIKTLGVFMLEIFDLGMKANHIPWTDSDIALFNALLFINPERPGLCDKEKIEQIEARLMQVLYRHVRRHHPNEPNMFLNILQLIPLIQEVNQIHFNAGQYIKREQPQIFNSLPNIHRDIYEGFSS